MIINGFGSGQIHGVSTLIKTVTTTATSEAMDSVSFSSANTYQRKSVPIQVEADASVYADKYSALYLTYTLNTNVTPSGNATWHINSRSIGSSSKHYMWIGDYNGYSGDTYSFRASNAGSAPTSSASSYEDKVVSINYNITWPTGTSLTPRDNTLGFLSWQPGIFLKLTGIGSGTQAGTIQGNMTTPYPLNISWYVGFATGSNSNSYTTVTVGPVTFGYTYSLYGIT